MCRAKGVVYKYIHVGRELFGEVGSVGLFAGMVSDVFQQQDFAVLQIVNRNLSDLTHAIIGECHGLLEEFGEFIGHRS